MNSNGFRKELIKIMPGYKWTVHRNRYAASNHLSATGIQTSGFNRLSTLQVVRREKDYTGVTLARALRGLQNHYEAMANMYSRHAWALKLGRGK